MGYQILPSQRTQLGRRRIHHLNPRFNLNHRQNRLRLHCNVRQHLIRDDCLSLGSCPGLPNIRRVRKLVHVIIRWRTVRIRSWNSQCSDRHTYQAVEQWPVVGERTRVPDYRDWVRDDYWRVTHAFLGQVVRVDSVVRCVVCHCCHCYGFDVSFVYFIKYWTKKECK